MAEDGELAIGGEAPEADEAQAWVGSKLDEMGGSSIGRVERLLVDARDGRPTWIVVRLGRFGRRSAIPVEFVAAGAGHVWVPFDRDGIRSESGIDPSGGLSIGDERALAARFGIAGGGRYAGELAELGDDEPGSVPAG